MKPLGLPRGASLGISVKTKNDNFKEEDIVWE